MREISEQSVLTNAICTKLFHIIEKSATQLYIKELHIFYLCQNKELLYFSEPKIY